MLSRIFIDRPVFAWVLSLVIVLIGAVSVLFLPVDMYPPITPVTVQVTATYPGANAQVVVDTVGAPIEQQVNGVEQMLYMSSQSTNDGAYTLTVTFEIGTDPNMAQVLVQNRVALAMPQLPPQVQLEGVSTLKTSPNILMAVTLVSPDGTFNDIYLSNYATIHVKDELSRLKGVGNVIIFGERDYSMRIWLDPQKLAARGATVVDVVQAVQNQNLQVAAGAVGQQPVPSGQQLQLTMSALGQLENVQQFGDIIVKTGNPGSSNPGDSGSSNQSGGSTPGNGSSTSTPSSTSSSAASGTGSSSPVSGVFSTPVVRVRDVAEIEMGAKNYDQIARLDGMPTTGLAIFQLPGSNALDVSDAIKKRMEELKRDFPKGLEYGINYDTTPFIRQSINDVFVTLLEAILLVAVVVLTFLQDWKAMILPMIDVPVSLVGTFAAMALLGFSLNNLTLFGLVLAIGIVVDDAIVVLENIERLMATGLDARTATIKAMDEITGPIIAITLVLCAVFIPSAFIPGLTGQFYRQFAVTIAVAMIISAMNAMTLTPARAVSIFKTEERAGKAARDGSHELKKEALPWWIFGVFGGVLTLWLSNRVLQYHPESDPNLSKWQSLAVQAGVNMAYLLPGAIAGGVLGWFIIGRVNEAAAYVFRHFNSLFDRTTKIYGRTVSGMLRVSAIIGVVYIGLLVLTAWRVEATPKGFIPTQDQGYLLLNVQLPDSASVQRTQAIMEQVQRICLGDDKLHELAGLPLPKPGEKKYPGVAGVAHTVGIAGESFLLTTNGSNLGSMFVVLKPWDERTSAEYDAAVANQIQQICAQDIEGAVIGVFRAPPIRGLGNAGGFKLQTEQRGYVDLRELQAQTDQLVARANGDPHFAGVFSIYRAATPQLYVDIDRTKVQSLQVPIQDVFTTLQVDMGSLYVNQFVKFGRTWQVNVQAAPRFRTDTSALVDFQVRNSQGQMMPLGTVLDIRRSSGPLLIMRYNMYASAAINGTPAPGVSSGDVITVMTDLADDVGVKFEWTEMTFLEVEAGNVALLVFALGGVLVYFVLAAKYESWRLPIAVILVVPLCMLAAVLGMTIAKLPVDIFVQIGLLVLVGLASKNAILIVEYARQLHEEGKNARDAAIESSQIRFRPIIMTSLAFIFGVAPLVMASGAGAEMRQSLGIAVFSGMIGVTLFGVILTPVFYYVLTQLADRRRANRTTPATGTIPSDDRDKSVPE